MNASTRSEVFLIGASVLALAFLAAGCGDGDVTGSGGDDGTPEMAITLSDPYGGMDDGTESPGYGDSYYRDTLTGDEPAFDALDAGVAPVEETPAATVLYLRVVWGRMTAPPEVEEDERPDCGLTVWDGSLSVSDGGLRPVKLVRWERFGTYADSLLLPRPDRQTIEWLSKTGCGRDGIVVKIVVPAAEDSLGNGDGLTPDDVVTFDTAHLLQSFPLAGLADLDSTIMIDADNGVTFTGFRRDDLAGLCRRGHVVGEWAFVPGDSLDGGFIRAAWMTPVGDLYGHLRGRFGIKDDGRHVWVGKVIEPNGAFIGFVRGTWDSPGGGHGVSPERGGHFNGRWVVVNADSTETHVGDTHGVWRKGNPRGDREDGYLHGVWHERCRAHGDDDDGDGDDDEDDGDDDDGDDDDGDEEDDD